MSKYGFVGAVVATVVIADRLTKWYIDSTFAVHESVAVIDPVFHITHLRNTGGAFSILAGQNPAIRLPFFLIVSAVAIAVIIYFLRQIEPGQRLLLFALAGMLGGAAGNLIDRVLFGEVIDFLDVHWRQYHWPPFNVADSFITIGACILVLQSFLGRPPAGGKAKSTPGGKQ